MGSNACNKQGVGHPGCRGQWSNALNSVDQGEDRFLPWLVNSYVLPIRSCISIGSLHAAFAVVPGAHHTHVEPGWLSCAVRSIPWKVVRCHVPLCSAQVARVGGASARPFFGGLFPYSFHPFLSEHQKGTNIFQMEVVWFLNSVGNPATRVGESGDAAAKILTARSC